MSNARVLLTSLAALLLSGTCGAAEILHPLSFGDEADEFRGWLDTRLYLDAAHYFEGKNALASGTGLRRARFGVHTVLYQRWEAELDVDLAGDAVDVNDTWIGYRAERAQLKFGQFKEPFGLERLTSSRYLIFAERAPVNEALAPGRKIGLQVAGDGSRWYGALGFFGQEADQDANGDDEAIALTGRFVYRPVQNADRLMHLGLALTRRTPDATRTGSDEVRYRSYSESQISGLRFLNTGRIAQVEHSESLAAEAALATGAFLFQGEYLYTAVRRSAGSPDLALGGGYLLGTWIATGERHSYLATEGEFGPVVPTRPGGAWELALRYSALDLNDFAGGIQGGNAKHFALGLNWYANPLVRALLNLTFVNNDEFADGGSPRGNLLGDDDYHFVQLRLQAHF